MHERENLRQQRTVDRRDVKEPKMQGVRSRVHVEPVTDYRAGFATKESGINSYRDSSAPKDLSRRSFLSGITASISANILPPVSFRALAEVEKNHDNKPVQIDNASPALASFPSEDAWLKAWVPRLLEQKRIDVLNARKILALHSEANIKQLEAAVFNLDHYLRMASVNMLAYRQESEVLLRVLGSKDAHEYPSAEPDVRITAVRAYTKSGGTLEELLVRPLDLDEQIDREITDLAVSTCDAGKLMSLIKRYPHRQEFLRVGLAGLLVRERQGSKESAVMSVSEAGFPMANGVASAVFHPETGRLELRSSILHREFLGTQSETVSDRLGWVMRQDGKELSFKSALTKNYMDETPIIQVEQSLGNTGGKVNYYYFVPFAASRTEDREASLVMLAHVEAPPGTDDILELEAAPCINPRAFSTRLPDRQVSNGNFWRGTVISVDNKQTQYAGTDPEQLLAKEHAFWHRVRERVQMPEGMNEGERELYIRSYNTLLMGQHPDGPVVASLPPADAYRIPWVRDMTYAMQAMLSAGLQDEFERGAAFLFSPEVRTYGPDSDYFRFRGAFRGTQMPRTVSLVRYDRYADKQGKLRWTESCDPINEDINGNGGDNNRNVEFDGLGLALHSLGKYVSIARERGWDMRRVEVFLREHWDAASLYTADVLTDELLDPRYGLIKPDSGFSERHHPGRWYAYTSVTAAVGLREASEVAGMLGDTARQKKYANAAERIKDGVLKHLVTRSEAGDLTIRATLDDTNLITGMEALSLEAITLGFLNLKDPEEYQLAKGIIRTTDEHLTFPGTPGTRRATVTEWMGLTDWFFADLRKATALFMMSRERIQSGDPKEGIPMLARGEEIMDWVGSWARAHHGMIGEQVGFDYRDPRSLVYTNINMVGYGGGIYIMAMEAMKQAQSVDSGNRFKLRD